ncbi:hypothetical protein POTOM_029073 [Populus tomentosa]|uniref:Uncharacterized protein n=1 Tax=Populus tomentosa TaxID=118781 RepID=A0A8X7Z8A9_POPTO|nr:hypothetical protein POTOM_029073 [Populus tomentosa]
MHHSHMGCFPIIAQEEKNTSLDFCPRLLLPGLHPQDEPSNQVEISSSSSSQRSCMSIDINSTDSCDMIEAPSLVLTLPHPIYGV